MPDALIIRLPRVRLSFPNLFKAVAIEAGKEPKFGCNFILDKKKHAPQIKEIEAAIVRAALDKFRKAVPISGRKKCLHDGEEESVIEKEGYGPGVMFIRASSSRRPVVVDRDMTPLTAEDVKPYAGCYVDATVAVFAWEHPTGGKGVSAELRAVRFALDGESFGAGPVDAEKEFEGLAPAEVSSNVDDY